MLSNILLNDLDWELEWRGLQFSRYADDVQIYVRTKEAGGRVMKATEHYLNDSLKLEVNTQKSAVDRPWNRTFLGFTFSRRGEKVKVSDKALRKLKTMIRQLSRRTRGHSLYRIMAELKKSLLGWKAYFGIAEVLSSLRDVEGLPREALWA